MSDLEDRLVGQLALLDLPSLVREHRFHPVRRWRFDLAWPDLHVACEVEGGTWSGGRHTRGKGFEGDCEKLNAAAILGWLVVRVTAAMISDGRAIHVISEAIAARSTT